MLTRIARFFGFVKYVSVMGYPSEWVRFDASIQQMIEDHGLQVHGSQLICWDGKGALDGYYIIEG